MTKKILIIVLTKLMIVLSFLFLFAGIEAQAQYLSLNPGSVSSNQSICYNTSPAAFTQTAAPTGGTGSYTYQWQEQPGCTGGWTNISGATATTYDVPGNITQTTCYRRNVTSGSCGTVSSSVITVTVNALPNTNAGQDETICIGSNTTLGTTAISGTTYAWSPTAGLSATNISNPIASPSVTTTYTVTVTDANGCSATDDVVVSVVTELCECDATPMPTTWDASYASSLSPLTLYELSDDATIDGNVVLTGISIRIEDFIPFSNAIEISILAGNSLILENCHLFACVEMWEGIDISGDGALEIINGSLIEDARTAVFMDNLTTSPTPSLTVDGSVFNQNQTGISINNYDALSSPYPFNITNTIFTSRELTPISLATWPTPAVLGTLVDFDEITEHYDMDDAQLSLLLNDNPALAGIALNYVGAFSTPNYFEMVINGDNGNGTINIFDNLYFGISAGSSNLTCMNNAFQYIKGTVGLDDGIGINANYTTTPPFNSLNRIRVGDSNEKNNYFYDCKIGINVRNYDVTEIREANIRSDHGLLEGFLGIGIQTAVSSGLLIENCTITNNLYGIHFTGLNEYYDPTYPSAYKYTDNFDITGNTIQANLNGNQNITLGADDYVYAGIVVNNTNAFPGSSPVNWDECAALNVSKNFLYKVENGIEMKNWLYYYEEYPTPPNYYACIGNRPIIDHNYISLVSPTIVTSQFGINTEANWNGIIKENYVDGFSNAQQNYWGIRCALNYNFVSNKDYGQFVTCNYVKKTGIGIEFQGNQNYTTFLNNTMDENQWGFVLNDGIIGPQGNSQDFSSKNKWPATSYGSSGQYKTYTIGSPDPNASTFVINNNIADENPQDQGQIIYNSGNPGGGSYIYYLGNGFINLSNNDMNEDCEDYVLPPSNKSLSTGVSSVSSHGSNTFDVVKWLERLVQDSVPYASNGAEKHTNDLFMVYAMLELRPALKDSSLILNNFYSVANNNHIGTLANATNGNAQGQMSAITPHNSIEANYINYYTVYSHYRDSTFTVADSIILKALVDGCPARDGIAVHKARTLYSMIYRDYTLYSDICIDNNSAKMPSQVNTEKSNPKNLSLQVYPNPNTGTFTISLLGNNSTTESAVVSIYNIWGNKMSEFNLQFRDNMGNFDAGLNNGVYFISVKDAKGNIYNSEKIIVIK